MLDQKRAVAGASAAMVDHRDCLKEAFSGPDSWMICAVATAVSSVVETVRRERRDWGGVDGGK